MEQECKLVTSSNMYILYFTYVYIADVTAKILYHLCLLPCST